MENATIPAAAGDLEELYAERDRHTKKRAALRNRVREIISEKMHSPLFLIVAIMMTGIAVLSLLSVVLALVQGGGAASFLGGLIVNVPAAICAIVSAVASWKMYGAKDTRSSDKIKGAGAYMGYMAVMGILMCIVAGFVAVLLVVLAATVKEVGDSVSGPIADLQQIANEEGMPDLAGIISGGSTAVAVVLILVAVLLMVFFICYTMTFTKANSHLKYLREAVSTEVYDISRKTPIVLAFIFGGLTIVLGAVGMVASWSLGLLFLFTGIYLILSAIVFRSILNAEKENDAVLQTEIQTLVALEEQITEKERKKTEQETMELRRRKEEEQLTQAQQQQMMQAMMLQMMQAQKAAQQSNETAPKSSSDDDSSKK